MNELKHNLASDKANNSAGGKIEVAPGVMIAPDELHFSFSRSGGPGGQNVNKVNSKAELRLNLSALQGLSWRALDRLKQQYGRYVLASGELQIFCHEERSQERNRQKTLERLREMLVEAKVEPKIRRKTRPTKGSKEDRLKSKRVRSEIKQARRGSSEE
jgi:ribosome-associated protein